MNPIYALVLRVLTLFFLVMPAMLQAQLCAGSLGDPVVNITFGSGSGPSSYTQKYTYVSSDCPADGSYTITKQTVGCFNNTWHSVTSDHTGSGRFMLVNASFEPGDFYLDTVGGLCPNTTYEFAAWIMNVLNRPGGGIQPNLTFKIERTDGTVLASYFTGDIPGTPTPVWKQYGFYFATPPGEARVVLRITNNAPGGIGNDLALDDITFRPCGSSINANIVGHAEDTIHLCEGDEALFQFEAEVSSDYANPVYFWQLSTDSGRTWRDIPGANTSTYQHNTEAVGSYWYRLSVVEAATAELKGCRIASNVLAIVIHPNPVVDAGPDKVLIKGNSATLSGSAHGEGVQFSWSPDTYINNVQTLKPEVRPEQDIEYVISATSQYGCVNDDSVKVRVVDGIYIPNAFTPNGDGKNDHWRIPFLDPSMMAEVSLFNRYGQLVYRSVGTVISWDGNINGKPQPTGVYVYVVKLGSLEFKGTVTLIR